MRCDACGSEVPESSKFCGECGNRLTQLTPDDEAERRPLTIVFVDLVGSTALSEKVDPEDYRDTVRSYYAICEDAIGRYDGYVVKYMGDGAMAYFGYPVAHAEDPQRAVLASLEIARDVPLLAGDLVADADLLNVRVGIHSGPTIVGQVGAGASQEALAVGDIPNVAARLEAKAPVGSVLVSETTHRLIAEEFEFEALGPQALKGVSLPITAYRVLRVVERPRTRLRRGRMVGREQELDLVISAAHAAMEHEETLVVLEADAGMGKSRLLAATQDRLSGTELQWEFTACSQFKQNSFLHPFIQLVSSLAETGVDEPEERQLEMLRQLLNRGGIDRAEALPLLASLLSLSIGREGLEYTPEVWRQRTMALIAELIRRIARSSMFVLVIEDVHWADPSTVELITLIAQQPSKVSLLMVLTARPSAAPWLRKLQPPIRHIRLEPLPSAQVAALVMELAGAERLNDAQAEAIVARSDGVPLFVEELVNAAINPTGPTDLPGPGSSLAVPATLRGLLAAQLDQLRLDKRLVQHASLLGHEFRADLLAAVVPASIDVQPALERLVNADILVQKGNEEPPTYEFRHEMLREAAYESLLNKTRRRLHERVAETYEDQYAREIELRPEVVAEHWERAGHDVRAAEYFVAAGERSAGRFANVESLAFYDSAIEALRRVTDSGIVKDDPESQIRFGSELLSVMERKGDLLARMRRQSDAISTFDEARRFAGNPLHLARLHRRIGVVLEQDRSGAEEAFSAAEAALERVEDSSEQRVEWLNVKIAKLKMLYWFDDSAQMLKLIEEVRPYVEAGAQPRQRAEFFEQLTLFDFRHDQYFMSEETFEHVYEYVRGAEMAGDTSLLAEARFTLAFCQLFAFRAADALAELDSALDLARRTGHRAVEVRCLSYLATAHRLAGNVRETEEHATHARSEAEAENMVEYVGLADANLAWVAHRSSKPEQSEKLAEAALTAWRHMEMVWPFRWLGLLPTLGLAVDRKDPKSLAAFAREMLDPAQQRLPNAVAEALQRLQAAVGESTTVLDAAKEVLRAAAVAGLDT